MKKVGKISIITLAALISASNSFANDHADIEGPFTSPMAVTEVCLGCHEDAAAEVMATSHWTWDRQQYVEGRGTVTRGKKNAFNNFCISLSSNWPRCTSCHVGYGWTDNNFDFNDSSRVDCLICHDTTGTYKKSEAGAGMPAGFTGHESMDKEPVDLVNIARNVGKPDRNNCVGCHANGGGGNNVKHGDMSEAMRNPGKDLDIHMDANGLNFSCQQCHKTKEHNIPGNSLIVSPGGEVTMACSDCHGDTPHRYFKLAEKYNKHAKRIACQTCHITHYAKADGTKMSWDWSQAVTSKEEGKKQEVIKEHGHPVYIWKKGKFTYQDNVIPEYRWFNGNSGAYFVGDKIDPAKVTSLNYPLGSKDDPEAKIMPFKIHRGKQIYDTKFNYLITPKVFGYKGDKEAFWLNYDWMEAARAGMKETGLEFSGSYDFAATETFWPINHQVDPKTSSLRCMDCHKQGTRMDWKSLGYAGDPMKNSGAE